MFKFTDVTASHVYRIQRQSAHHCGLRSLTKRNAPWKWGETEQKAFDAIKRGLQNSTFISYFDPNLRSQLIVDASPVGLAATLVQSKDNVRRVI